MTQLDQFKVAFSNLEFVKDICYAINLLHESGPEETSAERHLEIGLKDLTPDELFELLVVIGSECERNDHMIQMALAALKPSQEILVEHVSDLCNFAAADLSLMTSVEKSVSNDYEGLRE